MGKGKAKARPTNNNIFRLVCLFMGNIHKLFLYLR